MTTTEGTAAHDQRANRRAAFVERAAVVAAEAAKQRQTATITLDADDGATVTLATEEIRQTAGNTPVARAAGMSGGNSGDASGNRTSGDGNGDPSCSTANAGASASTLDTTAGDTAMNAGVTAATIRGGTSASGNGVQGGAGFDSTPPARRTATAASSAEQAPARPIIVREKAKALKLTKFKRLDDVMPVSMWLKTVRAEVRRQAVTMGVEWREKQLYHEVASHLEGEAQRWFATVMESVPESQETISTLSDMLRAKYMTQRTGPEVVDLLNARRQMRGERLVEYAQALREIGERGDVEEDWLVNAFLKGISSAEGAMHVRGHRPRTLDEAVELAVPHVGEYGEGYGVGLDTAMARWDEREASRGRGPLAASAPGDKEQSGAAGNFGTVVSGYGPMWGTAGKPPRYDTAGRPVLSGKDSSGEWWRAIPPGYQLVPVGAREVQRRDLKAQTASGREQFGPERGKRQASGDHLPRQRAKAFKVEGTSGGSAYGPQSGAADPVFDTREGRLQRHYERLQQRAPRAPFVPRAGTRCHYCNQEGHFVRDCGVKKADLAEASGQKTTGTVSPSGNAGNGQRA